jgi:hypothetical protein
MSHFATEKPQQHNDDDAIAMQEQGKEKEEAFLNSHRADE